VDRRADAFREVGDRQGLETERLKDAAPVFAIETRNSIPTLAILSEHLLRRFIIGKAS